jgi:hypothetical protein
VDDSALGHFPPHLAAMALEPNVRVGNADRVTHRSRNLAVVLGALTAGACSVYGPADLPTNEGGGGTLSGGKGGAGGRVNWGGAGLGAGGNDGMGGHPEEGGGQGDSAGASGAGGSGPFGGSSSGGTVSRGGTAGSTTGGTTASGGKASGGDTSGGAPPLVPPQLIDNMQDTNGQLYVQEGRDGYWYTSADEVGSTAEPAKGTSIAMVELAPGDGAGGEPPYAFHFKGKGAASTVSGVWGALGGFDLLVVGSDGVKHPYDAAKAYKGIHFWARAAAAATIAVRLPIRDTTDKAQGALCATKCEDHFGKQVALTTSWAQYSLLWPQGTTTNGFAQAGWGYKATFDAATLVGVQFVVGPGLAAEFWIDDVSFIPIP